jgi:endoglucanase
MKDLKTEDEFEAIRNAGRAPLMSRREFLSVLSSGGTAALLASCSPKISSTASSATQPISIVSDPTSKIDEKKQISFAHLPMWRGFNLLQKFQADNPAWNQPFDESDLDFIAEWGFDFIRLPMDYRIWTISLNHYIEKQLKEIDQVIEWAKLRGIHVSLCLHRAPGYCVNPPKEPFNLWMDDAGGETARHLFMEQWSMFAERYRNISSWTLSFNLVNEPPKISGELYARSVRSAINAIRQTDPNRLIIADGTNYGTRPVYELVPFQIAQSTRGYVPFYLTHYRASWIKGSDEWPIPTWPLQIQRNETSIFDRETLRVNQVEPWKKFGSQNGIGTHVGEWGAHNKTPHEVVLSWMKDCLHNWNLAGMGWALWNLRGSFGPLDSDRADAVYENYNGHKLDRKMLEILKEF